MKEGVVAHALEHVATHFINVDLVIRSRSNLDPLVSAFGKKVCTLHLARHKRTYCAFLELSGAIKDADQAIRAFCKLINALPSSERATWHAATFRDFNVGIQSAVKPTSVEFAISAKTVKAAADLGARIVFTVYGKLTTLRAD